MKITVRKGCFETNSSSNHTLIITNEEDMENDMNLKSTVEDLMKDIKNQKFLLMNFLVKLF